MAPAEGSSRDPQGRLTEKTPPKDSGVGVGVCDDRRVQVQANNAHPICPVPHANEPFAKRKNPAGGGGEFVLNPGSRGCAGQLSIEAWLGERYAKPDQKRREHAFVPASFGRGPVGGLLRQ
jgi:hypothetical protein